MIASAHLLFAGPIHDAAARIGLGAGEVLELQLPAAGDERQWQVSAIPSGMSLLPVEQSGGGSEAIVRVLAGPDARGGQLLLRALRPWDPARDQDPSIWVLIEPLD